MTPYNHSKNRLAWRDVECHKRFECVFHHQLVLEWHSSWSNKNVLQVFHRGKSYLRDTREILQAGMTLCFQSCVVQMALSRDSFSRGTREIHLFIVLSLSLHHLLHSTLTIKNSHKYRKIRLNKLESNLA